MGPVFWVLLETSITKGFKAAVAFDLGVMFADICFIGVCYLGSFQLLEDDQNKQGLFVLGGTILLLYGLFSWVNRNKKNKTKLVNDLPLAGDETMVTPPQKMNTPTFRMFMANPFAANPK